MENKSISSDLIRGHIDTIILYSLFNEDKFAQQISDSIEENSKKEYQINQATLYSSLKRLENLKHVTSYWKDADDTGRRKFFHLSEQGKKVVEDNLSSWAYSKQIIDRLVGCEQPETVKTVFVEVPIVKNDNNNNEQLLISQDKKNDNPITQPFIEKNQEDLSQLSNNSELSNQTNQVVDDENDINFRVVLGGLIKNKPKVKENIEKEPVKKQLDIETQKKEDVVEVDIKPKFDETIKNQINEDYVTPGKIDFSDLKINAARDGYKIRISSKDSAAPDGTLKINKLNFFSILISFILTGIIFLFGYLHSSQLFTITKIELILFAGILAIYPIISTIIYIISPKKTTTKRISADSILTCSIIIFNLLLVLFAAAFLTDMDFCNVVNLIKYIYTPIILMALAIVYFIIKTLLSKCKIFYRKKS